MPRGIHNWRFIDVKRLLNDYDFKYSDAEGSHHFFKGNYLGTDRLVCVPFHGVKSISPKTMQSIITQSGIPRKLWK